MKSKTYQKEGWFILEEDNQFFGFDAGNEKEFNSEEKFNIYHKDKETVENNIKESAKDLTDFFDSVIDDEPEISEEEVNEGIKQILAKTHPEEIKSEAAKTAKNKKVIFRALFVAALLSVLSFSGLYVVGSSHNISIENGFVTFAKDTVKIVFMGEEKEEYIDVKTLIEDLNSNGFENVLLPQELYNNYRASKPEYHQEENKNNIVVFEIGDDITSYSFRIEKDNNELMNNYFDNLNSAETITLNGIDVYVFEFENNLSAIFYLNNGYEYFIQSKILLSEMVNIAHTIIKAEE